MFLLDVSLLCSALPVLRSPISKDDVDGVLDVLSADGGGESRNSGGVASLLRPFFRNPRGRVYVKFPLVGLAEFETLHQKLREWTWQSILPARKAGNGGQGPAWQMEVMRVVLNRKDGVVNVVNRNPTKNKGSNALTAVVYGSEFFRGEFQRAGPGDPREVIFGSKTEDPLPYRYLDGTITGAGSWHGGVTGDSVAQTTVMYTQRFVYRTDKSSLLYRLVMLRTGKNEKAAVISKKDEYALYIETDDWAVARQNTNHASRSLTYKAFQMMGILGRPNCRKIPISRKRHVEPDASP